MLIGAGVRIGGGPHLALGNAGIQSTERNRWGQKLRNLAAGDAKVSGVTDRAGVPSGYRHPGAWVLPRKPGGLRAFRALEGDGTLTAGIAGGVNGTVTMTGTGSVSATAQLVVSAVATITGSGTVSANLLAILNGTATLTGTSTVAAELDALGFMLSTLTGTGTLTAPNYGTGTLEAEIQPFTELSPQSLAGAVWSALTADNVDAGSMGEALRAVRAILANRVVTDPAAGTYTVYDDDNTTVLLSGDLWQDADGTTAYAGAGAERRDRLI
jgi:hypothetical protein